LSESRVFTESMWHVLTATISTAFSFESDRASRLNASRTARLVAALPWIAGCRRPMRTALSHLATFVLAGTEAARRDFDHAKDDDFDVLARLAPIASFEGGDPALIARGLKLLGMVMINGYRRDAESDGIKGWYNPVGEKAWDAKGKIAALRADVMATPSPEMDAIMTADESVRTYWDA
jgi:hypothetical protein